MLLKSVQLHHQTYSHIIQKRGLINAGSSVLKWLVGTPSADDGIFYTNSINSLIEDRKTTHLMMKDQIKILSETMNTLNKTLNTVEDTERELNLNVQTFNSFINNATQIINNDHLQLEILDHLLLIKQLNDLNFRQLEQYSMTLTLVRHGIVDYNIINPTSLIEELTSLKQFQLPLKINPENIENYYKIMETKSFMKDDLLVVLIKIPIAQIMEYTLYQIFPLPTPHKNSSSLSYIEIDYPYIISSRSKSQFALLKNIDNCKLADTTYICTKVEIMERRSDNICELEIFDLQDQKIPKICKITTINAIPEIWQTVSENEWLFILSKPTKGNLLCNDGQDKDVTINGIGLLKITNNCRLITTNILLQPEISIKNISSYIKIPEVDILEDDCCKYLNRTKPLSPEYLKPVKITNLDLNDIKYTHHKLEQMDQNLQSQLNKPFVIKYESTIYQWACYGGIGLLSALLFYYIYKYGIIKVLIKLLSKLFNCLIPCKKGGNGDTFNFYNCLFGVKKHNQVQPISSEVTYEPTTETCLINNRRRSTSSSSITGRRSIRPIQL